MFGVKLTPYLSEDSGSTVEVTAGYCGLIPPSSLSLGGVIVGEPPPFWPRSWPGNSSWEAEPKPWIIDDWEPEQGTRVTTAGRLLIFKRDKLTGAEARGAKLVMTGKPGAVLSRRRISSPELNWPDQSLMSLASLHCHLGGGPRGETRGTWAAMETNQLGPVSLI